MKLYNGLTYDAHKGALATAQGMYFSALGKNKPNEVERWEAEEARIQTILDNWETLANDQ